MVLKMSNVQLLDMLGYLNVKDSGPQDGTEL